MSFHPQAGSIHLVSMDTDLAERVRDLPGAEAVTWETTSTLEELAARLETCEQPEVRVVVAVRRAADLATGWSKGLRIPDRSVRIVVVTAELEEGEARHIVFGGANAVFRLPLPPVDLDGLFSDTSYLSCLFPGLLQGRRREAHELIVPTDAAQVPAVIRFVCERLDATQAPSDLIRSLVPLIVDEAVTNAMKHGNGWDPAKTVHMRFALDEEGFDLRVTDQGEGFQRDRVADPLSQERLTVEGGRGLFLMEQLMDEVRYEDGGRTVVLRKGWDSPAAVPA